MLYSSIIDASIEEPYSQDIRKTSLLSNALSAWTDAASGAGGGAGGGQQLAPGGSQGQDGLRVIRGQQEVTQSECVNQGLCPNAMIFKMCIQ